MKRYITDHIRKDLNDKIVFITGARQVGKTYLSRDIYDQYDYFNYDLAEHRVSLMDADWNRKKPLVIFDEIHKMKNWKQWLKGIYDTENIPPRILVTGSAKLDTYRKVGDSLAGRYFQYRLHPIDVKEALQLYSKEEAFDRLWRCSGFPEPFLRGEDVFYQRWKRTHTDIILRQDLIDLQSIKDIQAIETLVILLKDRVGSTVSYANLARELEKDPKTIKRWIQLLENLYVVFKVTPFDNKITRSLHKEPKYYFYDFAQVEYDDGAKLENLVACALLKKIHYIEDVLGKNAALYFLRTKDGRELDFIVIVNNKPSIIIEVKFSDDQPSKHFQYFSRYFPETRKIQIVKDLSREKTYKDGLEIRSLIDWLANLDFSD